MFIRVPLHRDFSIGGFDLLRRRRASLLRQPQKSIISLRISSTTSASASFPRTRLLAPPRTPPPLLLLVASLRLLLPGARLLERPPPLDALLLRIFCHCQMLAAHSSRLSSSQSPSSVSFHRPHSTSSRSCCVGSSIHARSPGPCRVAAANADSSTASRFASRDSRATRGSRRATIPANVDATADARNVCAAMMSKLSGPNASAAALAGATHAAVASARAFP